MCHEEENHTELCFENPLNALLSVTHSDLKCLLPCSTGNSHEIKSAYSSTYSFPNFISAVGPILFRNGRPQSDTSSFLRLSFIPGIVWYFKFESTSSGENCLQLITSHTKLKKTQLISLPFFKGYHQHSPTLLNE